MTGRASATQAPNVRYVQTTLAASLRRMERLAERTDIDMFCLNDGGEVEVPEKLRVQTLRAILERMYPVRAPWEKVDRAVVAHGVDADAVSEARRSALSAHPAGRR